MGLVVHIWFCFSPCNNRKTGTVDANMSKGMWITDVSIVDEWDMLLSIKTVYKWVLI